VLAEVLGVSLVQLAYEHPPELVGMLEPDERELLSLYQALQLTKAEALRRLAGQAPVGVAWTPGAVRDQTSLPDRQPRRPPVDDRDFSDGPHDLRPEYQKPKPPPRKKLGG
jgi:hypothetical protein